MALNSQKSPDSLRVTMLIWSYWPGHEGGAEKQCRKIIPYLVRQGIQVTVVTARTSRGHLKKEQMDGCQILRLGLCVATIAKLSRIMDRVVARFPVGARGFARTQSKRREALAFWFSLPLTMLSRIDFMLSLRRWLKNSKTRPDVIHVHESSWLAGAATMLARPYAIPVLAKTALYPAWNTLGYDVPLRRSISKYRELCYFVALAQYLADDLLDNGIQATRIFVVPNGVEQPEISVSEKESKIVLMVANFSQGVEHKAFDVLLAAWRVVVARVPGAKLVLLGDGDNSIWAKMVSDNQLSETVEFTGWVVSPASYYKKASVFVLPSRVEGLSNALLEAQSYGLACVVSDIPGNLAVVEDGQNGLVVPVGNAAALAEALVRFLGDNRLRVSLGRKAREAAASRFSLQYVAERLNEVYRTIA